MSQPRPRRFRRAEPYVPPPGAPPMSEVIRELFAKAAKLRALNEDIDHKIRLIERWLEARGVRRVVRARIVPGVELAWSANKYKRWRLVIRDEDDVIDLFNTEPEERLEVLTSGALERLVMEVKRG